jgi:hypothetical protein
LWKLTPYAQEDDLVIKYVEQYGTKQWARIAQVPEYRHSLRELWFPLLQLVAVDAHILPVCFNPCILIFLVAL